MQVEVKQQEFISELEGLQQIANINGNEVYLSQEGQLIVNQEDHCLLLEF